MTTRSELLAAFAAVLAAEDSFLLPAADSTMQDDQSKIVDTQTSHPTFLSEVRNKHDFQGL